MMKKMQKVKKVAALSLAGLLSCSAFAACSPQGDGDEKKSHLNIKVFNGGFGYAWLNELEEKFEKKFENVSFEQDKMGVDIVVIPDDSLKDLHSEMAIGTDAEDIYYTSTADYVAFTDVNVAYDVTDIMTANVYDENGNVVLNEEGNGWKTQAGYVSIADKISFDATRDRLNVGTDADPKYYVLPFEDTVAGFIVDWDLIVEQGWDDYDGIDGMPATMNQFYHLLGRIRDKGWSGFVFTTSFQYARTIQPAVIAQIDGSDTYYDLFSDYTGQYDFNGDGEIATDGSEDVTPNTAYKLIDTKGYEKSVEMAIKLFEKDPAGNTFYDPVMRDGVAVAAAQKRFLMSKNGSRRIAMLLEGEWWENEARAFFNSMAKDNEEDGYGKREFRMMPIPTFDSKAAKPEDQKYTLGTWSGGCVTVVNEKTVGEDPVKQKLAELWLQYQNSTEGLKCFTKHTGVTLPLNYTLEEDELKELTPFAQNLYKLKRDPRVEFVYNGIAIQENNVYRAPVKLDFAARIFGSGFTDSLLENVSAIMATRGKKITVADYIAAMHANYDEPFKTAVFLPLD